MDCAKMLFVIVCVGLVQCQEDDDNNVDRYRGIDTKGMLATLASGLMARGYGTNGASHVISLNLTNLLVLILLKALIFAAGSLGAGNWKGGYARSADGTEHFVTEEEILMYLSYLTGSPGNNTCLQNIACNQPFEAKKYTTAGDMLLKASKMVVPEPDESYSNTLKEVRDAVYYGMSGGNCNMRYKCTTNNR